MRTDLIRAYIDEAWQSEVSEGQFAALIRGQLLEAGADPLHEDAQVEQEILLAWRAQLESVPGLLEALHGAAKDAKVSDVVDPVIEAAESYLLKERDILPDSHGIMGLFDDMYIALSLIHKVSEGHRTKAGRALIEADLRESIASVRGLFRGTRLAKLDEHIRTVLEDTGMAHCAAD